MHQDWGRGVGALVVLGALWVLVYWLWEPSRGKIVFEDGPGLHESSPLGNGPDPLPPLPSTSPAAQITKPSTAATPSTRKPPPVDPGSSPPARLAVIPPTFRTYTVKKGDTWESIAAKELGSRDLWQDLTRANPLMTDLKPGRAIHIPTDPTNIQGRPVTDAPAGAQPAPEVEYTVKSGDTLGGIAKAYYGSTSYKDLIFSANKGTLDQEDQLKIGQKLKLPPKPN